MHTSVHFLTSLFPVDLLDVREDRTTAKIRIHKKKRDIQASPAPSASSTPRREETESSEFLSKSPLIICDRSFSPQTLYIRSSPAIFRHTQTPAYDLLRLSTSAGSRGFNLQYARDEFIRFIPHNLALELVHLKPQIAFTLITQKQSLASTQISLGNLLNYKDFNLLFQNYNKQLKRTLAPAHQTLKL